MDIVIIGTGNVAYALAGLIKKSGHILLEVSGRNESELKKIAGAFDVPASSIPNFNKEADLYIVAISDDALYNIGEWLSLERKLVVHTAGSVSKEVLQTVSRNYGVLYPLQSLKKGMKSIPEIPFLVDGNTADDLALIRDFALSLSSKVEVADDEARRKLHLAAVVVNNFTNHLYALAEEYCKKEGLSFDILQPLIMETTHRIKSMSPKTAQTGPAIRNDLSTIKKQLDMLKNHPELRRVYEVMTESIVPRISDSG